MFFASQNFFHLVLRSENVDVAPPHSGILSTPLLLTDWKQHEVTMDISAHSDSTLLVHKCVDSDNSDSSILIFGSSAFLYLASVLFLWEFREIVFNVRCYQTVKLPGISFCS